MLKNFTTRIGVVACHAKPLDSMIPDADDDDGHDDDDDDDGDGDDDEDAK
jgi:hypothetical protein